MLHTSPCSAGPCTMSATSGVRTSSRQRRRLRRTRSAPAKLKAQRSLGWIYCSTHGAPTGSRCTGIYFCLKRLGSEYHGEPHVHATHAGWCSWPASDSQLSTSSPAASGSWDRRAASSTAAASLPGHAACSQRTSGSTLPAWRSFSTRALLRFNIFRVQFLRPQRRLANPCWVHRHWPRAAFASCCREPRLPTPAAWCPRSISCAGGTQLPTLWRLWSVRAAAQAGVSADA